MDVFGLKDIATTLIVGTFTILIVEAFTYFVFAIPLTHAFHPRRSGLHQRDTQIFLFVCFAVGLITEDVLWKSRDAVYIGLPTRLLLCNKHVFDELGDDTEDVTRTRLVSAVLIRGIDSVPTVTDLGEKLARHGDFSAVDPVGGRYVESHINHRSLAPGLANRFNASMQKLWYEAHNRVLQEDGYRDEMNRIETRERFTVTIARLAHIVVAFATASGIVMLAFVAIRLRLRRPRFLRRSRALIRASTTQGYFSRVAPICLALYLIYIFALWACVRESMEYDKRVFGYYDSLVFETANPVAQPEAAKKAPKQPGD